MKLPRLGWIRLKEEGYLPAEGDSIHKATSSIVAKAKPPEMRPRVIGIEDLTLSDRTFRCDACVHAADRDENEADNMLALAVSSTERINGRRGDVRPLDSERRTPEKRQSEVMAHLSSF